MYKQVTNWAHHRIFELLSFNPHAITLAAPLLQNMSLKELYLHLDSHEITSVLEVEGIKNTEISSLKISLEVSLKVLKKDSPESLEFFFLMGLLPGGVSEQELDELYGEGWET